MGAVSDDLITLSSGGPFFVSFCLADVMWSSWWWAIRGNNSREIKMYSHNSSFTVEVMFNLDSWRDKLQCSMYPNGMSIPCCVSRGFMNRFMDRVVFSLGTWNLQNIKNTTWPPKRKLYGVIIKTIWEIFLWAFLEKVMEGDP